MPCDINFAVATDVDSRATDDFSPANKIHDGGYGPVYKASPTHNIHTEILQCKSVNKTPMSLDLGLVPLPFHGIHQNSKMHVDSIVVKSKRGNQVIVAASPPTEDAVLATDPLTKEDLVGTLLLDASLKKTGGTEHEKFGFELKTLRPMNYGQIADLLNAISERFVWEKIMEGDNII
ncbi:hypothetical protein L2E82_31739 [Cichorium intybus]|uniref:Uncharacterized protein n=1 Tax=Cichorium intybus TaxID=13427 RepID=A0ACB9BG30_CICIN|nr:hypothetical protein L2E82_31739 [Cichorium intybus]